MNMFELIEKVKEVNPLVLNYTNEVTINDCANITLAIGASPLMSYSYENISNIVKEIVKLDSKKIEEVAKITVK